MSAVSKYMGSAVTTPGGLGCQGDGALSTVTVRFEYDAWNRRAGRWDAASGWTEYVHDPAGRVLGEMRYVATAPARLEPRRDYVWLDGKPLAQLEYPGPAGRTEGYTYWYHLDQIGMPRGLTNESGQQMWAAPAARPYGDIEEYAGVDPLSGRPVVTNLRLPGQYDERLFAAAGISGLQGPYYNWNRWYLPTMGRYMELDPIALHGGINGDWAPDWYGYAGGSPLTYFDPDARSKTTGVPGDDIAYRELRDAMKLGRPYVNEVAERYLRMQRDGLLKPERWRKIKGWIKLAKDGRLPMVLFGICLDTLTCKCIRDPEECKALFDDLEGPKPRDPCDQ